MKNVLHTSAFSDPAIRCTNSTSMTNVLLNTSALRHFRSCNQMHAELQLVCIGLMFAQEFANDGLIVCRTLSLDWIGLMFTQEIANDGLYVECCHWQERHQLPD